MNTAQLIALWYAGLLVTTILLLMSLVEGSASYVIATIVLLAGLLIYTLKPHPQARKHRVLVAVATPVGALVVALALWLWATTLSAPVSPGTYPSASQYLERELGPGKPGQKSGAPAGTLEPGRKTTRQWTWSLDMNGDKVFTVTDVWASVKWLFFYPADVCIYLISQNEGWASLFEAMAQFLETTPPQYGGLLSFVLSAIAWLLVWGIVVAIKDDIRDRQRRKQPRASTDA